MLCIPSVSCVYCAHRLLHHVHQLLFAQQHRVLFKGQVALEIRLLPVQKLQLQLEPAQHGRWVVLQEVA
jgi:hypothetical protein